MASVAVAAIVLLNAALVIPGAKSIPWPQEVSGKTKPTGDLLAVESEALPEEVTIPSDEQFGGKFPDSDSSDSDETRAVSRTERGADGGYPKNPPTVVLGASVFKAYPKGVARPHYLTCPYPSGLFPHPYDCGKFLSCSYDTLHVMLCPKTLHFHPGLLVCVWPYQTDCRSSFPPPGPGGFVEDDYGQGKHQTGFGKTTGVHKPGPFDLDLRTKNGPPVV